MSKREAARVFGIDSKTVVRILKPLVAPGYQRPQAPVWPRLDRFAGRIVRTPEDDGSQLKTRGLHEAIMPLACPPGPARVEFRETVGVICGPVAR